MAVNWRKEAGYPELIEFLVEKTKNVKEILNRRELERQFTVLDGRPLGTIRSRFESFRSVVQNLPHLDTETKVKLMFGLSVTVDHGFQRLLDVDGIVELDEHRKIVGYVKRDGRVIVPVPSVDPVARTSPPATSSGNNSITAPCLPNRKRTSNEANDGGEEKKTKKEIKSEQPVKLEPFDGPLNDSTSRRILIDDGDDFIEEIPASTQNFVAPLKEEVKLDMKFNSIPVKKEENEKKSTPNIPNIVIPKAEKLLMNSKDLKMKSKKEEGKLDVSKTSTDKPIPQNSISSTKNKVVPKYEELLKKIKKEVPEIIILDDPIDKEIKEERNSHVGKEEKKADDEVIEVIDVAQPPNSSKIQVKEEQTPQNSTASGDVKEGHTSLLLVLNSFHKLIDTLDISILSDLQKKIEAKLEECKKNSTIQMISNKEIYHTLEVFLLKINNNWEIKESVESFRLETFTSLLAQSLAYMNCPSLVEIQEKLKKIVGELRVQNKIIPVTAIRNALQIFIDTITS